MSAVNPPPRYFWLATFCVAVFFLLASYHSPPPSLRDYKGVTGYSRGASADDSYNAILNKTLGFQRIYVINLRSRPDRRDTMALAAHFTNLQVDFVDGVTELDDKAIPIHAPEFNPSRGFLLARRAHMNIARLMVEEGITSALILEDDTDWDVRIKTQMQDFAQASRLLLQPRLPVDSEKQYWDVTMPRASGDEEPQDYTPIHRTVTPTTSPYGDVNRWDVLWLGHCGTRFPRPTDASIPLGRVVLHDDETVPEPQHIGIQFGNDELVTQYPAHSRVVHRVAGNACPIAYGLSLPGARRMLHDLSSNLTEVLDFELTRMCEGFQGKRMRTCLTVQPQLFQHHRPVGPKGKQSDISDHSDEYRHVPFARNIRLSTKVNLPKLIEGEEDYIDTFPDGAEARYLGW